MTAMKVRIQLVIEHEDGDETEIVEEVGCLQRGDLLPETLGITLKSQGLTLHQAITFLSDGGDTVRNLQVQISPYAEHVLDWFHVAMRITTMKQMAVKFLTLSDLENLDSKLDSVKWYLWHGNVFCALQRLGWIRMDLDGQVSASTASSISVNVASGCTRYHCLKLSTNWSPCSCLGFSSLSIPPFLAASPLYTKSERTCGSQQFEIWLSCC